MQMYKIASYIATFIFKYLHTKVWPSFWLLANVLLHFFLPGGVGIF